MAYLDHVATTKDPLPHDPDGEGGRGSFISHLRVGSHHGCRRTSVDQPRRSEDEQGPPSVEERGQGP